MHTPVRSLRVSWTLVSSVTGGTLACRSSVPEQVLSQPTPVVASTTPRIAAGFWAFHATTDRQSYVVTARALLSVRNDTTLVESDSVSSHAELAFSTSARGDRVTGLVTAFRVQSSGHEVATPAGLGLPIAFSAIFPARGSQLVFAGSDAAAPCSSSGLAAMQSLRDLFFQPPETLRVGTTWEDSSSYVTCRDGLLLRATVIRKFRVSDATFSAGRAVLTVQRASHTEFHSDGRQADEPVSVSGSGAGELTLSLDPAGGLLLAGYGSSTVDLTLRGRFRSQRVRQTTEILIARSG